MRTIWKGHLQFSLVTIPIRLYTAVDSGKSISFDLLTKEGHHPVGYTKTDKVTGKPVSKEDIVKGYEYEPDQYVIIEDEDFKKVEPKTARVIEIKGFVETDQVHPTLFDRPYYLGPENDFAKKTYTLFRRTLEETGKSGVGTVALRSRESPVLLTFHENGLLMYQLRYPNQLRQISSVPNLDGLDEVEVDPQQLKMAKTLVDSMSADFNDIDMDNRYYETMMEMIEAKVQGKDVVSVADEAPETRDIMSALKESIESSRKPMKKAKGKEKKKKSSKGKTG